MQVENLGCEGKVEEAQGIMKLCEQLEEEKKALKKASEANHWFQVLIYLISILNSFVHCLNFMCSYCT